jgi:hypothetical protein
MYQGGRGGFNIQVGTLALVLWCLVTPGPMRAQVTACDEREPCEVSLESSVFQTIERPGGANYWWLTVTDPGGFRLQLTSEGANYRLYVYSPDGTLLGLQSRLGAADLVIEVPQAPPGRYSIIVDRPEGPVGERPYELRVTGLAPGLIAAIQTESWASDFGPVTLSVHEWTDSVSSVDGWWAQPSGTGACPPTGRPCRGEIYDGRYDRATRTLTFTYYEDWVDITGSARLVLSEDGLILAGTWTHQNGATGSWTLVRVDPSLFAAASPARA